MDREQARLIAYAAQVRQRAILGFKRGVLLDFHVGEPMERGDWTGEDEPLDPRVARLERLMEADERRAITRGSYRDWERDDA